MKIIWNKVTKFSQAVAVILFISIFFLGIALGRESEKTSILGASVSTGKFVCDNDKYIDAVFYNNFVNIKMDGKDVVYLPQTISGSGARYANTDESLVFWNKGNEALIMRNNNMDLDYKNCHMVN